MKKTLLATETIVASGFLLGLSGQVKADTTDNQQKQSIQTSQASRTDPIDYNQNSQNHVLATSQTSNTNSSQISYQRQTKQLTETIYFQDTAGQEIAPVQKQTVTVSRTNTLQDGTVIKYGAWSKADFAQVKAPEIAGYTPTQPYLDALPANQSFYFIWQYRKDNRTAVKQNTFQPAPVHAQNVDSTHLVSENLVQVNNSQIHYPAQNLKNANDYQTSSNINTDSLQSNYTNLDQFQKRQTLNTEPPKSANSMSNNNYSQMYAAKALPQTGAKSSQAISLAGLLGTVTLIGLCGYRKQKQD